MINWYPKRLMSTDGEVMGGRVKIVREGRFKIDSLAFQADELIPFIGQTVYVERDGTTVTGAYTVYDMSAIKPHTQICMAGCITKVSI